ncbi:MAG: beta-ketoacyl synthase [Oligosphaeraceae bacterium]|nr:beta-ketoacyl synthase [Oligosphaeraceae bacterium]
MTEPATQILFADAISAAGNHCPQAEQTFFAGRQAFSVPEHFAAHALKHGLCSGLQPRPGESRAIALFDRLAERLPHLPPDTAIFLATTVGAIDCLEQAPPTATPDCPGILLDAVRKRFPQQQATLISAACASGQIATACAMRALRRNRCRAALVIGLDITSEFVTSGFASLGAVSRTITRPYDEHRDGLLLGEGAGAILLSQESSRSAPGRLLAARESCDAAHITAPDLSGQQLASLISATLQEAGITPADIGGVIGHGTGTLYNDQSEIAALAKVFGSCAAGPPLVSIKGNLGHTLAASGILQIVYGLTFLRRAQLPPQAGLRHPALGAEQFVAAAAQKMHSPYLLSLNVGFGGLNSALLLEAQP